MSTEPGGAPAKRSQWRPLVAAWLGWAFDGLDGYLYILVATRFVTQLLDKEQPDAEVAAKSAIIQGFFLVGWAVGGAVFGRIGDRLGRSRTLTITILTYAVFTGMAFFATEWWHLLIFRFIAALGIGGEWAAGSSLVSETLHPRHRAWASAALQSGYMVGIIAAVLSMRSMSHLDPRYVFLVGVLPAFVVLWIRRNVPEPEQWKHAAASGPTPPLSALFAPGLRRTTLLTMGLTSVALTTVWSFLYFSAQMVTQIGRRDGLSTPQISDLLAQVIIVNMLVNIVANFAATYLARAVGARWAFFLLMLGALASLLIGFWSVPTRENLLLVTSLQAFFGLGLFGIFPLYIPPLFPTLLRTMGAGVTYNIGRLISAAGTFTGGAIAAQLGGGAEGAAAAIWWTGLLYIPGLLLALRMPDQPAGDGPVR